MHNLELTGDQILICDTVKKYVQDAVAPGVLDRDEHRQFARAELQGLGELGLFGLPVAESNGGAGMGLLPLAAAVEEIASQSGSLARLLTAQVQCALALARAGNGPVDEVIGGGRLAVYVGPEFALQADGTVVRGACELVPGGGEAALFVVAARGDGSGLYLVEGDKVQRSPCRSLGLHSTAPARLQFGGSGGTLVAGGADALAATSGADLCGWICSAAACVGMGRAAVQLARKHAGERIAFGRPLLAQQAVVRKLVESQRAVEAARHLVFHAARLSDLGADAEAAAMTARIAATDAAVFAADEAIQIHGGYGYTVEYHVERHYRDSKTLEVLDGGNEALKDRLAALQFAG